MLALALTVILAAAAADEPRIPGTNLRLGWTDTRVLTVGSFAEVSAADAQGLVARQGDLKFFGVPSKATLYFRNHRLDRARFEASDVPPQSLSYVEDQLRRQRYWQECKRFEPERHDCVWLGAVKVHLDIGVGRLDATVEPVPQLPAPEPIAAARGTPQADTAAGAAEPAPPPAPPPASPTSTPVTAPSAGAPATTPAHAAPAQPAFDAVATLPETLKITLVTKNSASDWPRIVSAPPLDYPDAAKRESVQGVVWVLALVNADGTVRSAQIERGPKELHDSALDNIRKSRFAACVKDGHPCRFWVRVALRYTLF
jgi:TonB family protein